MQPKQTPDITGIIQKKLDKATHMAERLNACHNLLFWGSITSSALASILAFSQQANSILVGTIALMPAVFSGLITSYPFQPRIDWHFFRVRQYETLRNKVFFAGLSPAEAASDLEKLEEEVAKSYPTLPAPKQK